MSEQSGAQALQRGVQSARASFEYVEGWGMAVGGTARVVRPTNVDELRAAFAFARAERRTIALRGSGCSYGDASISSGGLVLDLSRMQRILAWDSQQGIAELEPGVTFEDLWKRTLPDGWWPRVVPGTMFPTIGGAVSMNIHGKNNFAMGTIGEAVREFEILLPNGELRHASRDRESELFHAAIGGFGMLGVFTRIVLEQKRVHSGQLEVRAVRARSLAENLEHIERRKGDCDYLVSWIDAFARGKSLGRGLIHEGRLLAPGEDSDPARTQAVEHQNLPGKIAGVPKSEVWRVLRFFNNDSGMRAVNALKYRSSRFEIAKGPYRQSHAAFAFLLDYVPNWKWAYGRNQQHGLIQYQAFVPHAAAERVFTHILEASQDARIVPYLAVLKRHRPDPFLLTHGLAGWSLALDFKVEPHTRERLWRHCGALTETVLDAGGRFYFAKDATLDANAVRRMFPPENLARFLALKRKCDPELVLQTDLWRRAFAGM